VKKPTERPNRKIPTLAMPPEDSVDLDETDVAAIRAVMLGKGDPVQQVACIKAIVEKISRYYHLSYRPDGKGGQRATDFLEGRRSVGQWLVNLQHMSPKLFEKKERQ
jgi:hypothetical protein